MDFINDKLTAHAHDRSLSPAIKASLELGKKTLNRYYSLTDSSEVYRIAMVLHPRHKLSYFTTAGWEAEWVETAKELVRDVFERSYKQPDAREEEDPAPAPAASSKASSKPANMFDSLPSLSAPTQKELRDDLDRYLSTDPEMVGDVLVWWHEHRGMYPSLSRMALDYLTIPATSVDVERLFSRGRLLLSHVRSRLSAQSTRALLCLGSWSRLGLVKDTDVLAVTVLDDVEGDEEPELDDGWDRILL